MSTTALSADGLATAALGDGSISGLPTVEIATPRNGPRGSSVESSEYGMPASFALHTVTSAAFSTHGATADATANSATTNSATHRTAEAVVESSTRVVRVAGDLSPRASGSTNPPTASQPTLSERHTRVIASSESVMNKEESGIWAYTVDPVVRLALCVYYTVVYYLFTDGADQEVIDTALHRLEQVILTSDEPSANQAAATFNWRDAMPIIHSNRDTIRYYLGGNAVLFDALISFVKLRTSPEGIASEVAGRKGDRNAVERARIDKELNRELHALERIAEGWASWKTSGAKDTSIQAFFRQLEAEFRGSHELNDGATVIGNALLHGMNLLEPRVSVEYHELLMWERVYYLIMLNERFSIKGLTPSFAMKSAQEVAHYLLSTSALTPFELWLAIQARREDITTALESRYKESKIVEQVELHLLEMHALIEVVSILADKVPYFDHAQAVMEQATIAATDAAGGMGAYDAVGEMAAYIEKSSGLSLKQILINIIEAQDRLKAVLNKGKDKEFEATSKMFKAIVDRFKELRDVEISKAEAAEAAAVAAAASTLVSPASIDSENSPASSSSMGDAPLHTPATTPLAREGVSGVSLGGSSGPTTADVVPIPVTSSLGATGLPGSNSAGDATVATGAATATVEPSVTGTLREIGSAL